MKLKNICSTVVAIASLSSSMLFAEATINQKSENTISVNIVTDGKTKEIVVIRKSDSKEIAPTESKITKATENYDFKNSKPGIADVIYEGVAKQEVKVIGLSPATLYSIDTYKAGKKVDSKIVNTLAVEPKSQTTGLAFKDVTENQIGCLWKNGDGNGRIVCISTDKQMTKPQDGVDYVAGKFGDAKAKVQNSNTYVVYNSTKQPKSNGCKIPDLKENTPYTIQVFEFNGAGESINYLVSDTKNNPRIKATFIAPPVALEPTNITKDGFQANWKTVNNVKHYEFDLSKDPKFSDFVDIYQSADIGDLDKFEFTELAPGTYYYRLKSVGEKSISGFSNVMKVVIK